MSKTAACLPFNLPLDGLEAIEAIEAIRQGVRVEVAEAIIERGILPPAQLYGLIGDKRRLARRRAHGGRLTSNESERLLRVLRVADRAADTFGDDVKGCAYLSRPMRRFDGRTCVEMLDTDIGAGLVEELLSRVDHGIPS